MLKKIVILPTSFLLAHFLYLACINCRCPDIKEKYFRVENITVMPYGSNNSIIDTGLAITNTDTISLQYQFVVDCISHRKNPFAQLVNAAYACSCADCGHQGIKSKITTFDITSDSVYNGIPANTSLNNIFKVKSWNYFHAYDRKTLDTVKTFVNKGYPLESLSLFSTTKPLDAKGHRFTITLTTEDGNTRSATTRRISWN